MSEEPKGWDAWKRRFDAWEDRTARRLETGLKSPLFLEPVATALTLAFRAKIAVGHVRKGLVSALGLPTKEDQERTLHAIHRLESRLYDLEERLEASRDARDDDEPTRS